MPFRDNYTNFWFNDISSETMKVWVTNNKDLQMQLTPSFSDTFVAPVAAATRYHTATTFTSSDPQLKCIAIGVTMRDWRAIQNWLAPHRKGKLQFDFNNNTYYEVKIKQQIKGTAFVDGSLGFIEGDVYNIEFTVDFTTVGDWAALGPQVVVPINGGFEENEAVEALSPVCSIYPELSQITVKLSITYNDVIDHASDWGKPEWWTSALDETHGNYEKWLHGLDETYEEPEGTVRYGPAGVKKVIGLLVQSVANLNIATLSSAINNKYYMPMVYNKTQSANTRVPTGGASGVGRVYLTQPTVIHNKTIKLDMTMFEEQKDSGFYETVQYFFFDGGLEWLAGYTGDSIDFTQLRGNYLAYAHQGTLVNQDNAKAMLLKHYPNEADYGLEPSVVIDDKGISFYGVPVLFGASSNTAYNASPFYYEEDGNSYAVMNAGSYDCYPDLYVNLGRTVSTTITKDSELLYQYNLAIKNASLVFNGKTGFATFNNMLAEAATLSSGSGNTKVVTDSINNGIMSIAPGNAELLKIRVFGLTESKFERPGDITKTDPVGVTHIFFQPVGEFKYPRNGQFAALLFHSVTPEQPYDSNQYPLINRNYLQSSSYGSRLNDYSFTINGFIYKAHIATDRDMWVLTLPTSDLTISSLVGPELTAEGALVNPVYMYLSLCNYSELSIVSDTSSPSYMMMQTRDAF